MDGLSDITDRYVARYGEPRPGEKVFVVRDGKARSQVIRSGIRTNREVQVEEGLHSHDTVIVSGLLQLKEGMDVKVKIPKGK